MLGKMEQSTGENSDAYQAKRDININNTGMDYRNVKQLCIDLIHENFPKLQEEAMLQVNENVLALADELKKEIEKKKSVIDPIKLAQPDVQAAINEAVQGAAKKGRKSDLNLLASLVISRIGKGNSDLLDITIEEAIRLTPKLTFEQIKFLSVKHFLSSMFIQVPNISFAHLDNLAKPVLAAFSSNCSISVANIRYLAGVGVLDFNPMFGDDAYSRLYQEYPSLSKNVEEFKEKIKIQAPSYYKLVEIYNKENFSATNLNSFGQVIALTNLGRVINNIDLKVWIN
ncbi:MAG: hypothetical protein HRU38_17535 [Saccharospirillaceae bacterium]|nr:hypothetical protein [Pseudomonadales bacterium]NRB80442.1 hypothetical protein [Saccharospirillaceae bacterium]